MTQTTSLSYTGLVMTSRTYAVRAGSRLLQALCVYEDSCYYVGTRRIRVDKRAMASRATRSLRRQLQAISTIISLINIILEWSNAI